MRSQRPWGYHETKQLLDSQAQWEGPCSDTASGGQFQPYYTSASGLWDPRAWACGNDAYADVLAQSRQAERASFPFPSSSTFCSIQALNGLTDAHPHWEGHYAYSVC